MKIIINQSEIEDAIKAHVGGLVSVREGTDIGITFASTRGEDGIVATIDINYLATTRIAEIADAVQTADTTLPPQRVTTVAAGAAPDKSTKTPGRTKTAADKKSIFEDVKNPEAASTTATEAKTKTTDDPIGADAGSNPPNIDTNDESKPDLVDTAVTTIADAVDGDDSPAAAETVKDEEAPTPTAPKKSLFS